ncbi:hypothetical protein CR205_11450 [Alteribacter lacisalsi]|uniref:Uncharacterized protein n=1 Tax=Alteribacter lacisalsi TaxID=2045244 RepID=A0A2W0HS06_9BACI|nr:hypothetical protein [Alteribacter lacisalsi]PYZ96338.1 hypothetical protein CR205_11450 [Alteribacter lacisalsi]
MFSRKFVSTLLSIIAGAVLFPLLFTPFTGLHIGANYVLAMMILPVAAAFVITYGYIASCTAEIIARRFSNPKRGSLLLHAFFGIIPIAALTWYEQEPAFLLSIGGFAGALFGVMMFTIDNLLKRITKHAKRNKERDYAKNTCGSKWSRMCFFVRLCRIDCCY